MRIRIRREERVVLAAHLAPGQLHAARRTCTVRKNRLQQTSRTRIRKVAANLVARVDELHTRLVGGWQQQHARLPTVDTARRVHGDDELADIRMRSITSIGGQMEDCLIV